jgi:hypothetical protein
LTSVKISLSISKSNALVASSKIKTSGLLYKALAIPILCFCPPDIRDPLSPICVSSPNSSELINFSNEHFLITSLIKLLSIISSGKPNAIFLFIVSGEI